MRPSAQPFLWKWVLFAWEWKIIYLSKAEHLTSFWYRGPGELGNGLFWGKGVQMEVISEGIRGGGGGWLCEVFFPGASYYTSVVAHPLIISVKRP